MPKDRHAIQIYTDGSYKWDRERGGYGAVMVYKKRFKEFSCPNHWVDTTHNRMEMKAILASLRHCDMGHKIDIYCDNRYCVDAINHYFRGRKMSYLRINKDLWRKMWDELRRHRDNGSRVTIKWVRGHSGNIFNEMADKLADKSCKQEKGKVCK